MTNIDILVQKKKKNKIQKKTKKKTKQKQKKTTTKNKHHENMPTVYNIDPLKPHFYIVKLGFTGVYIIFLISAQKHRVWVLVRTTSLRRF